MVQTLLLIILSKVSKSNAKTTAKDVIQEKEKPTKEAPDKQKPVPNEQINPNRAQQPID